MPHTDKPLLYIKVPEEYALTAHIPGFDASIPLPLLADSNKETFSADALSEEMILAGMLTVFAYERDNQHIAYYRDIFKELRPDIRQEMTNAAILKIKNGDFELAEQLLFALEGLFPEDMRTKLNVALLMDERAHFYEQAGWKITPIIIPIRHFIRIKQYCQRNRLLPKRFLMQPFFLFVKKIMQKRKICLKVI